MNSTDIRLAVPKDRNRVVETIVAAFAHDPAFTVFFGDQYPELGPVFAGYLFDRRVQRGTAWVVDDGAATALWDGPDESIEPDEPAPTLLLPPDAQERLDNYDHQVHEALPEGPIWYLGILASHPDTRGRGLGRLVAEGGLARARAERHPAVLETTNPDNVGVYERSGWRVHRRLDDVVGLTVWVMVQD